MLGIILGYAALLLAIGMFDFMRHKSFEDFVVAGRQQGSWLVTMSILATVMGGSATLGVTAMAYEIGFPAFWWLGAGSIGLILQSLFLSGKVHRIKSYTLPDMAEKILGPQSRLIVSVIILLAWIGIIAAQIVAASKIITSLLSTELFTEALLVTGVVMILYSFLGGQYSILKTDFIQFVILGGSIVLTFVYLYFWKGIEGHSLPIEFRNESFGIEAWLYFLFIVGGSFFLGPDLFSRLFTARDERTARSSSWLAALFLLGLALMITLIGLWAKLKLPGIGNENPLIAIMAGHLPKVAGVFLSFGLLSAVVSSADTCLVTTAAIFEHDLLKKRNLADVRRLVLGIGFVSLIIALIRPDIISLLLAAFSLYSAGIVMPFLIGIINFEKRRSNPWVLGAAVIAGGSFGLVSNLTGKKWMALAGMGVSLIISLGALIKTDNNSL
ncbi:sodium:solute symporter [Acidobacteriota bacterium]